MQLKLKIFAVPLGSLYGGLCPSSTKFHQRPIFVEYHQFDPLVEVMTQRVG